MTRKGFTAIVVIFVLVALIAAITLVTYFLLTNQQGNQQMYVTQVPTAQPSATPKPVSDSTDLSIIEDELNQTDTGAPQSDLESIETDVSGL